MQATCSSSCIIPINPCTFSYFDIANFEFLSSGAWYLDLCSILLHYLILHLITSTPCLLFFLLLCVFSVYLHLSSTFLFSHWLIACLLKDSSLFISEVTLTADCSSPSLSITNMFARWLEMKWHRALYVIYSCVCISFIGCMEPENPCSDRDGVHWWNWGWSGGDRWDDAGWKLYCSSCT